MNDHVFINMKPFVKVLLLCVLIFSISLYITKITIDSTFKKVECNEIANDYLSPILNKIKEV